MRSPDHAVPPPSFAAPGDPGGAAAMGPFCQMSVSVLLCCWVSEFSVEFIVDLYCPKGDERTSPFAFQRSGR
jgi:hypothetical protein